MIPSSQAVVATGKSFMVGQHASAGQPRKERENRMKTGMGRSEQTPHETAISESERCTPEINQSKAERQSRMWSTMRWFDGTAKTEAAFYVRFKDLPDDDVTFLKSFYHIGDDRDLFNMICKFWDIGISSGTPIA